MMDALQAKNPLYPLLCVGSSVVVLICGLLLVKRPGFPVLLAGLCLLYCIFGFWRQTLKCLLVFLPVSAVFAGFSWLFQQDLVTAVQMGGRVLLVGISSIPVVCLPQINLTRNLAQLRCPRIITLGMLIAVRFVPVLRDEVRQVREAMKTRGVRASLWNFKCFYRALLIPLTMRLINLSDTLSLSLETRGFELGKEEASVYRPVRFRLRDGVYLVSASALVAGMVVFG